MLPTRLTRATVVALAAFAVACGDPSRPRATYANALAAYQFYALTGAPAIGPNALAFFGGATRATASFAFDVAFDIDAQGRAVIYPVRTLGGAEAGILKRVGLQPMVGSFDSIREVPETGYDTVNVKLLNPGNVLAVEIRDPAYCYSSINIFSSPILLYAKMVVDSVKVVERRLFARVVIDPNCGYRMVVPDSVPTN